MSVEGSAPTDNISQGFQETVGIELNFGIELAIFSLGVGGLIQSYRKTLRKDNEKLRMVYCQYQTKRKSQRVCLAAYKIIHIAYSQRGVGGRNLWARSKN